MNERVQILHDSKVISSETYEYILRISDEILNLEAFNVETESSNMFWTHLSIAVQRALFGEQIDFIDEIIIEQIEESENIDEINYKIRKIEDLIGKEFSRAERGYISLHLGNLLGGNSD